MVKWASSPPVLPKLIADTGETRLPLVTSSTHSTRSALAVTKTTEPLGALELVPIDQSSTQLEVTECGPAAITEKRGLWMPALTVTDEAAPHVPVSKYQHPRGVSQFTEALAEPEASTFPVVRFEWSDVSSECVLAHRSAYPPPVWLASRGDPWT